MVIPLVGDFTGPLTLVAIGDWVRTRCPCDGVLHVQRRAIPVSGAGLDRFRRNVASMPLDRTSTFIRSCFNNCASVRGSRAVTLLDSIPDLLDAVAGQRIGSYWDVLIHSRVPGD